MVRGDRSARNASVCGRRNIVIKIEFVLLIYNVAQIAGSLPMLVSACN